MTSGEPGINGTEFAGEVVEVGPGVTRWRKGDRVMGVPFAHGRNAQAQLVLAHELTLMRIPDRLSFTDAAAFPVVYMTAHDAVVTNGELKAGRSVLVNGASGGVAVAAIQIASLLGAKPVFATSRSSAKLERLKAFGATAAHRCHERIATRKGDGRDGQEGKVPIRADSRASRRRRHHHRHDRRVGVRRESAQPGRQGPPCDS